MHVKSVQLKIYNFQPSDPGGQYQSYSQYYQKPVQQQKQPEYQQNSSGFKSGHTEVGN